MFTRRNLPHWYVSERACFVTYVVRGALAAAPSAYYRIARAEYAARVGRALDREEDLVLVWELAITRIESYLEKTAGVDTFLLADARCARVVFESLLWLHERGELRLLALCIMSNHVHIVADYFTSPPSTLIGRHKSFSSNQINKLLGRTGRNFHDESFDHLPRTLAKVIEKANYTVLNPVVAGMVARIEDHSWTWYNTEVFRLEGQRLVLRADCVLVPQGLR